MDIASLLTISLAMTQERSAASVMQAIVEGLNTKADFALARIWVKGPGDLCEKCSLVAECADQSGCLHLVASHGVSNTQPEGSWDSLSGRYRRVPFGARAIGHIVQTGEPILIEDMASDTRWNVDIDWVHAEGIRSFAGYPLVFRGEVLGVIGIFCRLGMNESAFHVLGVFAHQAAIAIANARAFEEIERLKQRLEEENEFLRAEMLDVPTDGDIVGASDVLARLMEQIRLVAPTEATVLVQGESGTGKELIAKALHRASRRADRPLVKVNCAAIPRDLFESEFFGHVKGAFTGAIRDRIGRFQLADRGTLFLDEVGEIPLDLQSKLLRVLQEGEFERIGEGSTRRVNVRVIAATNRDLLAEVRAGRFREDLYYRLGVFPVEVPPLRERREDIPILVAHFAQSSAERLGLPVPKFPKKDIVAMVCYSWPGNVRELAHFIERAVIVARGGRAPLAEMLGPVSFEKLESTSSPVPVPKAGFSRRGTRRAEQIETIRRALDQSRGRIYGSGGAAEILGMKPTTLTSRIKRWGIE